MCACPKKQRILENARSVKHVTEIARIKCYIARMINELHYRELFCKTFDSLARIGRRKSVNEKTRKDLEFQLRIKMAELSEINALLKEKGTRPLYESSYNMVYGNYRRLLEEEIGRLQDQLRFD